MHEYTRDATGVPSAPISAGANKAEGRLPLIQEYLRVLVRRKWYVVGAVVGALALALILTLLATPRYTATTQIEINREGSRIVDVEGVEPDNSAVDMEFYQTQYGLLGSRSLASDVMKSLRLADNEQFLEIMGINAALESKGLMNDREAREEEVIDVLLKNVNISPIRLSRLVNISAVSPDPELSSRIANNWAEMFIRSNLERRFDSTAYARTFLEQRLAELRKKLEESERQAVGYASNQAIINLPGNSDSTGDAARDRSLVSDNLAALNSELAAATAARIAAEARLSNGAGGATTEALENVAIAGMRERLAEAEAEYARMLADFTPDYPAAQALKAQVDRLRASVAREETRVREAILNNYRDAKSREDKLIARVESLKSNFNDQRRRAIDYNILQREVDTNRQIYDALLQRYKEIGVAAGVGSNNISIVDRAAIPDRPSSPQPLLNLALALFAGILVGIVLAFVREQFDEAISDPAEIERRLNLPLLGVIPAVDEENRIEEVRDPKSGMAEAYLSVETRLGFATDHGVPRLLTVTSTRPAEGKSTTAFALAFWLARGGAKTLFVDGDLRSPSLQEMLGVANTVGLSNILSGSEHLDAAIRHSEADRFDYITAGPRPPNAADLLRGRRLQQFFDEALQKYDHVVIDSPPVMGLADALIIGSATEGTVFVVEAQGIKARLVQRALERLHNSHANILGVVLSKFDARRSTAGYDYGYGYGYGARYGEAQEAG